MNKLVSVIIPIYNVEKYLSEALESVINQTYTNLEILCINDGSTDNSYEILKKYAKIDSRIRLFNQENQGLSRTRNTGLSNAKGSYIAFLDPDDYYEKDFIEKALEKFVEDVDFVTCNMTYKYETEEKREPHNYQSCYRGKYPLTPEILHIVNEESGRSIFKQEIIARFEIKFPENLIYEDVSFILKYISVSKNIYIMQENFYNYRLRKDSILYNAKITPKIAHRLKNLADYQKFTKKNNIFNECDNEVIFRIFSYFSMDIAQCGNNFKNRYITCKEAHELLKHYKISKNQFLKSSDIIRLNFLKSPLFMFYPIYYKINFVIRKILRNKHSYSLL